MLKEELKKNEFAYSVLKKLRMCKEHIRDLTLHQTRELKSLQNKYKGERCFIVVTGPSLTLQDLEMLRGEYSFSVNSIVNVFDKTDWRPNFYVVSDPIPFKKVGHKIEEYQEQIEYIFLPNTFRSKSIKHIAFVNSYTKTTRARYYNNYSEVMPTNTDKYFVDASTVTFTCMQLARYLGFSKVYLLGQDCDFSGKNQHSALANPGYNFRIKEDTSSILLEIFSNYYNFYKDKDFEIFNCTRGGKLEVFPRVRLEDIIKIGDCIQD